MKNRGSILIFALWVLGLLAIFAVSLGILVRQKIHLLSTLEERSQLRLAADSGIKKSIAILLFQKQNNPNRLTVDEKEKLYNDPEKFQAISVGKSICDISYVDYNHVRHYGLMDEESKINVNFADRNTLYRLIRSVLTVDDKWAQALASVIVDWRGSGESQLIGFYSDEYYSTLEFPMSAKHKSFERIEELMLLKGFTTEVYDNLFPYLTVYGDGKVNVNTATKPVLMAIGLEDNAAEKLLAVRRGKDNEEATNDDYVFMNSYDLSTDVGHQVKLVAEEVAQLDNINLKNKIKTYSSIYFIDAQAYIEGRETKREVQCVYDTAGRNIIYWREK